ncbi:MAG: hypothetical protein N2Z62_15595 [Rhodobacteraceae bacterium]|nr:hypothetical protein [Paracoccaceae bacterium]
MRSTLMTLAGAAGVAALALGPAAILTLPVSLLSADAAQAKGNGNGGGNGNGNGGGKGAERGNGAGSGQAAGNGNRGGDRGTGRPAARSGAAPASRGASRAAPEARGNGRGNGRASNGGSSAGGGAPKGNPAVREAKRAGFHASELGNMNGAMNANINAVLAHIRNGNTNGPVGRLAGLAVADAGAAGARDLLGSTAAQEQIALRDALAAAGYDSLAAYEAAVAADPTLADPAIDAAAAGLGAGALAAALAAAGHADLAAYEAAIAADPTRADPAVEAAIAGLGAVDEDLLAEIAEAEGALAAVTAAEQALLDSWNKNRDADPAVLTEEEQRLLEALRARLAPHAGAIGSAVGGTEPAEGGNAGDPEPDDGAWAGDPLLILR